MARARTFQSQTTSGEFSPRLDGRVDIARYGAALKTMENFVAQPHGGAKRRTGTHYVAEVKDSTARTELLEFEFSDTQAYVIEAGDRYFRFYMNHGQIQWTVLAGELITNGTFNAGITGWSVVGINGTGAATWNAGLQALDLTGSPLSNQAYVRQSVVVPAANIGQTFTVTLNNRGAASCHVGVGITPGGYTLIPLQLVTPGVHVYTFVATATVVHIEIGTGGMVGSGSTTIDDVSIRANGANLMTEGEFTANIDGWTDASTPPGAIVWTGGGGFLDITGATGRARHTLTIAASSVGLVHHLQTHVTVSAMKVRIGTAAGLADILPETTLAAVGPAETLFTPTTTTVYLEFLNDAVTHSLLDYVRVPAASEIPYEIVTPYLAADIPRVNKYVQSADVMYLVHPSYPVQKLTRTGHTAWTLTPVTFLPPPTTEEQYKPVATLTPAATTGLNILFTASAAVFLAADVDRHIIFGPSRAAIQIVNTSTTVHADILDAFPNTSAIPSQSWGLNGSPNTILTPDKKEPVGATATLTASLAAWRSTDVGKYVKINDGIIKITQFTDTTHVKGEIIKALSVITAAPAGTWTLEVNAWSATRGYPSAVSFHEGRLVFGGTNTQPQSVWGSASGDFENFAVGTAAGDAYEFGIAANKVNIIRWLLPSRVLLVGTKGGEFRVTGGADLPITPTNVDAKSETAYGSNFVAPMRISSAILFCQRSGRKVRELAFSLDFDSYVAPDLTVLAEHIFPVGKTIDNMKYQQDPDPVLWVVRSDGLLCALSYDRSNDVVGWHRHPMDGAVEAISVIPHPDGDREEVWLIVNRTINGATKRYIEYMDDAGGFYDDLNMDSTLTYTGAPATTFAGLEHLRGKVVQILGDGAYYGEQTVPLVGNAEVVISPAASAVEVGLPYTSAIETLRADLQAQTGSVQGQKKRQAKVTMRFLDSMGMKVNSEQKPARRSTDPLGSAPPLFSGDLEGIKLGWNTEARNTVTQTLPFPCNLLGIFATLDVAEY